MRGEAALPRRRKSQRYVSRGGDKLESALTTLDVDVSGLAVADLGASVGGFTDCLLQHGAAKVYAVDTAYGILAWKLRQDDRVVVLERTNALHACLPEPVDLVTVDAGWTPMHRILPAACGLLRPGSVVVALLKPQYEAASDELERGVVPPDRSAHVSARVIARLREEGYEVEAQAPSAVPGSGGNREWFIRVCGP